MTDTVLDRDACDQAAALRSGELSCAELTELAIRRIESRNPELNCVVAERFEEAMQEAQALDARGSFDGLAGVPVLLKDLGQQVEGLAQTDGSRAERVGAPREDSAFAARYRGAGMVVLGKASSPEFGNHSTTEPVVHGPCRNPWDTTRTAGGSSGGSAAAVAAGMIAVAGASDGAGSIRIPSSCCGTFGLKPSRGLLVGGRPTGDAFSQLAVSHAITRSVRDSALLLDICSDRPATRFADEVGADPGRLHIGISIAHPFGGTVGAEPAAVARATAERLESLGHAVEEAAPVIDVEAITGAMLDIWATANADGVRALQAALGRELRREELEETTWELVEHAERLSDADMRRAAERIAAAGAQIAEFFGRYDLWLTPTVAQLPPLLGELNRSVGSAVGWWRYDLEFNPWCPIANVAGGPAASLPLGLSGGGLPVGAMLTAAHGQEALLIRTCSALEALDLQSVAARALGGATAGDPGAQGRAAPGR